VRDGIQSGERVAASTGFIGEIVINVKSETEDRTGAITLARGNRAGAWQICPSFHDWGAANGHLILLTDGGDANASCQGCQAHYQ
jgi:hypothetical protein